MKVKRLLLIFFVLAVFLALASCAGRASKYYTVEFDSNGAQEYKNRVVAEGTTVVEPSLPTKHGYNFLGWYLDDFEWNFETDTVTSDIKLKAKWEKICYVVTFDTDGGNEVAPQVIGLDEFASKPQDPTKENSRFIGWYNGEQEWDFTENKITENITLTAKWADATTYTVSFDSNGGAAVENQYIVAGNKASKPTPDPERAHYVLLGWYAGEVEWNFDTAITGNLELKAKWHEPYTVTFATEDNPNYDIQYASVNGEAVTEPATPTRRGYAFVGWYYNGTLWNFETVVAQSITLVAEWESLESFVITFDSNGGPELEPITVYAGELIPKPDISRKRYELHGWYDEDTNEWDFNVPPTRDMTLKAYWDATTPMVPFG